MKVIYPGVYKQVESIGLKSVICECGSPVFAAGMDTVNGHLVLTCLTCGLITCRLYPDRSQRDVGFVEQGLLPAGDAGDRN